MKAHQPNAFGFLRLLFASLVIVSHVPELADGDRHREILTRLLGSLSFGEVAVAGFFIISGYLITGSYLNSRSIAAYIRKRVLRIYPAFIVASLVCIFIVAPLAGGDLSLTPHFLLTSTIRMAALQIPDVAGSFAGTPKPYLDGAMWTIPHEFRCYLLVIVLGATGMVRRRWPVVALAALCMLGAATIPDEVNDAFGQHFYHPELWFGTAIDYCRMTGLFLSGAAFYLFRDRIRCTPRGLVVAAIAMLIGLTLPPASAYIALALIGPYLVMNVAERVNAAWMQRVNSDDDISYGVYLYAWPVNKLLLLYYPGLPLVVIGLCTFAVAVLCGWASWHLIERPAMELRRARQKPATPEGAARGRLGDRVT